MRLTIVAAACRAYCMDIQYRAQMSRFAAYQAAVAAAEAAAQPKA